MSSDAHHSPDQGRQTRHMWWAIGGVFILLVSAAGWILFYDGPPPADEKMLPQWTQHKPGKPYPLAEFIADIDPVLLAEYDKLSPDAKERKPGSEPELRAYLAKQQVNLDAFDKLMLTDTRTWQWPDGEKLADAGHAFTNIGAFGAEAQILRLKIHLLKVEGKIEEAVALSLNMSRFGAGLQSAEGMLLHSLVGMTCQRLGEEVLRDTLVDAPASPELLRRTLSKLEAIPSTARGGIQFAYKGEYLAFKNATEKMDHGQLLKAWSTTPSTTVVRNQFMSFFFKRNRTLSGRLQLELPVVEALDRSWVEAYAAASKAKNFSADYELNKNRPGRYFDSNFGGTLLLAMVVDSPGNLIERAMTVDALKRQAELMLALRLFELEKGRLPAKLAELLPDYMAAIPEDVFNGKPMRWDAAHKVVYSDGPNGIDDGGRIDTRRPHKGADVGMRYWWSKSPAAPADSTTP